MILQKTHPNVEVPAPFEKNSFVNATITNAVSLDTINDLFDPNLNSKGN